MRLLTDGSYKQIMKAMEHMFATSMDAMNNAQLGTAYETLQAALEVEERDYRKELWVGVAIAVAHSEGSTGRDIPGAWANKVLDAYNERFGDCK